MTRTPLKCVMLAMLTTTLWGCPEDTPAKKEDPIVVIVDTSDMSLDDMATGEQPDSPQDLPDGDINAPDAQPDMMPAEDMTLILDMPDASPDMIVDMAQGVEPGPRIVASFNVELFFDDACDTGDCGENSYERLPTTMELQERYIRTAAALDRLAADVIVLQEIETETLFDTLLMTTQQGYTALAFGETGREASIDVGIAARGELLEVFRHRDDALELPDGSSSRFARELLEVHFDIRGARVIVFGAHYISKFNPENTPRRTAEATRTAELALAARARHPDALVIVAGDLNDTPGSDPLNALSAAGLILTSEGRELEDVYTNVFDVTLQIIDHILYLETPGVTFSNTDGLEVFRDEGSRGLAGSDHASPRATFVFE